MVDSTIAIDEPATIDKRLDTEQLTVGVNTVERERIQIVGAAATEIARILAAAPAGTEMALIVRNIPSGTQTISGTVTANAGTGTFTTDPSDRAARLLGVLSASTNNIGDVDVLTLPAITISQVGTANDVDVLTLPALVAGTANIGDVDLAQYTPIDVDTGAGVVNALPITWRKASALGVEFGTSTDPIRIDPTGTTAQPVTDNAGSLTIDGSVGLLAGINNIGDVDVLTLPALVAGTANIGDVDVLTLPALVAGTANIGDVDVLTMPLTTVHSDIAHDAIDAGNPLKIGGQANLNEITAVAVGDRVNAWFDQFGRLVVLHGHANPEPPVTVNGGAAGIVVIAAPGAGVSLYIQKGSIHNRGVEQVISLRDGAAGTIRFTMNAAADGGGTLFDFGSRGWKLTANTALVADIGAASADINITEFYIAA